MPELRGHTIRVRYRPRLTAWRGQLLSKSHKGDAVYAGCFLRKRQITLDASMLRTPRVLERIFIHEVFHFVWSKLDQATRRSWDALIRAEVKSSVRGELAWSAESMKNRVTAADMQQRSRRWKDYLCESFCDTAAWYFGTVRRYAENTLDRDTRDQRRAWVLANLAERSLPV
ncbi:MAG TPA: hypothetical protein VES20_12830 [Bryobacteraceae bacterium]|nr:hypothetical protein [Bryobacteraceae bacterium]